MIKKISFSVFALLFGALLATPFFSQAGGPGDPPACEEAPLTWADLSKAEKIEAFSYFMESGKCEFKGIKLYGKVQFVESFPDFTIEYVSSFPDIKVKMVSSFPDDCGEWQEVKSFPDFKVKVVTSFPDLKVKEVDSFPGME